MKKYESDEFIARNLRGSGYLLAKTQLLEEMKREIDDHNERMISRGFKPEKYLITHEERYRWVDDDGIFVRSEIYEQAVEIYPATLDY